ncbi:MAG: GntR family transcriptional regulator [Homoserinimonas sp.]|nr:GntR family transcriptional regulator [Homoserinimonas sp.]MCW5944311.1 GntR family transcriptional regulator [Cryobacterium sp.]
MQAQSQSAAPAGQSQPRQLRYQLVYDLVLDLIEEGDLRPGAKLPSTNELAELANVSVISVRRALDELSHAGKIVRHQGVGTFVAPQRLVSEPSKPGALLETLSGVSEDIEFTTELISIMVGLPSTNHAEALGISEGQPVWEVCRLRSLDSVPKVLERAVMPLTRVPSLDEERLSSGESLYGILEESFGLTEAFVEQSLKVDQPTQWEREHLGLDAKDSVVRIRGVSFTSDGVAFDSYQQSYRAHDFVFYVSGSQTPTLLSPGDGGRWSIKPLGGNGTPTAG